MEIGTRSCLWTGSREKLSFNGFRTNATAATQRRWSAAQQWPAVAAELSQEQIAHGDLQHANIMVTPDGKLKLVDYDGMCVPALVGAESLEFGTPPYQHPQRNKAYGSPCGWMISLRC